MELVHIGVSMPHGKVKCCWNNQILVTKVFGPFNISGVEIADRDIRQQTNGKKCDVWYRLDILDENTLGCPDVMKVIGRSYLWSVNDETCKAIAVVCANNWQYDMMLNFIEQHKLPIKCFLDVEQAHCYIYSLSQSD
jgi:hypothetical protein